MTPQALALGHEWPCTQEALQHIEGLRALATSSHGVFAQLRSPHAAGWMRRVIALCPRRCRNCRLQITSEHHVPQHVSENYSGPQAVSIAELSCQALSRAGRNLRVGGVRSRARFIFQACLPCVSEGLCSNMQKAMLLEHLMEPTSCVELLS